MRLFAFDPTQNRENLWLIKAQVRRETPFRLALYRAFVLEQVATEWRDETTLRWQGMWKLVKLGYRYYWEQFNEMSTICEGLVAEGLLEKEERGEIHISKTYYRKKQ